MNHDDEEGKAVYVIFIFVLILAAAMFFWLLVIAKPEELKSYSIYQKSGEKEEYICSYVGQQSSRRITCEDGSLWQFPESAILVERLRKEGE